MLFAYKSVIRMKSYDKMAERERDTHTHTHTQTNKKTASQQASTQNNARFCLFAGGRRGEKRMYACVRAGLCVNVILLIGTTTTLTCTSPYPL